MKKVLKGFLAIFLAVVMSIGSLSFETFIGMDFRSPFEIKADAAKFVVHKGVYYPKGVKSGGIEFNKDSKKSTYDYNWEYWSQGASKYRWKNGKDHWMKGGCRIVAYSKLLVESGIAPLSFNPDVLLEWAKGKKCIKPISEENGYAGTGKIPVEYAKSLGDSGLTWKKINFQTSNIKSQAEKVYNYIKEGKYVIVCCGEHYSYVSREYSLATNTAILSDSSSEWSKSSNLVHRLDTKPYPEYCNYKYMLVFEHKDNTNKEIHTDQNNNSLKVTFNANGGSVSTKSKSVAKGGTYGTLPTPTRSGYKFVGWYTKASGGTKINSSAKVTSSHTVYAHWDKIPNKISFTVKNATNITQNSAKVSASCNYSGTRPSEVSVYIGTTKNNMKKYSSDKINHSKNPFDVWYNIKNLKPGTTYYYQFHAVVNGTDKVCNEIKSFTTKKATPTLSMNVKGASKIAKNSARVDATCSYTGTRPSEVSVYIGTSKNNMKKYSSDAINHSKNPFNIWYNFSGLKKNTTYYYQFHAKVNGVDKAYGEIKSFKTAK